ncbi:hypothetical protein E0H73_37585 [Kribbella pittospori]|uniref:Uncharacterized protein n=1 Tax=Kribbella pittospori TaxID=722689 RepID=A0A4R0K9Q5_9ACTN|nr:hypothetical protein [Kribbella pittospori]TCC54916.1 hypothetical protein E0H73_37585 [Kribbella pittospori]
MTPLNDNLPDLMNRATENLEPNATDLVERGIRRGQVLRRRRTALAGAGGAFAVLATVGIVVAGTQALGGRPSGQPPFAAAPTPAPTATSSGTTPSAGQQDVATKKGILVTLQSLLPPGTRVSKPTSFGDDFIGASVRADDGKGASYVEVLIKTEKTPISCPPEHPENCTTRPDGTLVIASTYAGTGLPSEPRSNYVTIAHPDGRTISLGSANATAYKKAVPTRAKPLLSTAQLIAMADSPKWTYPPVGWGRDLNR